MASISAAASSALNQDTFLQLLIAQVRNQNPLEPVSDTEFIAQLAQFNTLSSLQSLNASFDQMLKLQQLTQGAELVGRRIEFLDGNNQRQTGVVGRVTSEAGQVFLEVGTNRVTLSQVTGVLNQAPAAA